METIWNLDNQNYYGSKEKASLYLAENGYDKGTHEKFKIGDTIQFWTGYNNDIRAQASIKGINGNDLYVYNDCYWYPIQDDSAREIVII